MYMSSVIGFCGVIVATVKRVIERRESNTVNFDNISLIFFYIFQVCNPS